MTKVTILVSAVDWCGYEDYIEVAEASEEVMIKEAVDKFAQMYGLMQHESGDWGDIDDFDEEGEPIEEDSLTTIDAEIYED
jgi:hypothetical protein